MQAPTLPQKLAQFAPRRGNAVRLNWALMNEYLHAVRNLRLFEPERQTELIEYDLRGFDYVNLDGLTLLLTIVERLKAAGHGIVIALPDGPSQQAYLEHCGFIAAAGRIGFLEGRRAITADPDWEQRQFVVGQPHLVRLTEESAPGVQRALDRLLTSEAFLRRLGFDPSSESGFWYAPRLARAIHELVRNVVHWSGTRRGYLGVESIRGALVRVVIADCGLGIRHTLGSQGQLSGSRHPIIDALLHRYKRGEEPGLFHVVGTVRKWGGEFRLRSEEAEVAYNSPHASEFTTQDLVNSITESTPMRRAHLPGVQVRIDFNLPAFR